MTWKFATSVFNLQITSVQLGTRLASGLFTVSLAFAGKLQVKWI